MTVTVPDPHRAALPVRWDIQEEHLEEAGFLFQLWDEALRSPEYTLAEIADGPETRLLAHLDGLVLGGSRVARALLLPALAGDEPGPVFAAAFALLSSEDGDFADAVLEALAAADPDPRRALRRALATVPVPALGPRLATLAPKLPALQADLLEVLASLRIDPGLPLEPLAASPDPERQALALRLARALPSRLDPLAVTRGFATPHPAVRAAALETGMILGLHGAFAACEATVAARGPAFDSAALLLALSGDPRSADALSAALAPALSAPDLARPAAYALGFTGQVAAADALLAAMADDALAPVAAEAFTAITGLAIDNQFARPPRRWDPDAEDEAGEDQAYGPEADLPTPDPQAVAAWWADARKCLDPAQRWLRGSPWTPTALLRELEAGPARRRHPLALDLAIRSRGHLLLACDALSSRQRAELAAAQGAVGRASPRAFRE